MRIAQIAPLMESVPPKLYGGTERIVSYLTEELVRLGHDVALFASGDSVMVSCVPTALPLNPEVCDVIPYYMLMLDRVRRQSHQFDILHFHMDYLHFPLFRDMSSRVLTTLHGRQDLPDNRPIYIGFDEMRLISISNSQRIPIPNANFAATIYHGLPGTDLKPTLRPRGGYLAFRSGDRDSNCTIFGYSTQNSGESRSGGRTILSRTNRAIAGPTRHRIHWRNQ
jgi:glycosyltransferase involved in cell wall biosynthesis